MDFENTPLLAKSAGIVGNSKAKKIKTSNKTENHTILQ